KTKTKTRGKNASKANAKRQSGKGAKIKWDPSGIVYEAVLSNPVEGATVLLYTYNAASNSAVFVDSSKFGVEPNPQTTGADGHYEWYVPEGWWQVRASKEGYSSFSTGDVNVGRNYGIDATRDLDNDGVDEAAEYWMPVLPIQLDVNLPLVSKAKPTVKAIDGDVEGVVVEFSKYMKPETVTAGLFTVAGKVPSKIEAVNAEEAGDGTKAADGTPVKYASKFKLYYPAGTKLKPGKHKVEVTMTDTGAKAKSYADAIVDKLPYKGEVEFVIGQETQVMYRLYNPNSGEHFYTASEKERDSVVAAGWKYEGIGWVAPAESSVPVYRLYSGTDHHYTMDKSESDWLQSVGWRYEGIGWYSDEDETVPLWREFNPNVDPSAPRNNSGSHNYTTSKSEHDYLCSIGWRDEGIGWYAVAEGTPT
ncbi:MAG: hypothetical protein Q4C09_09450, partial [Atopobiaceae bacterium]|nr:hypothetical protein [Atopobiaceae bacterium]